MVIAPNELLDCDDMHNAQLAEVLLPYKKCIAELEHTLKALQRQAQIDYAGMREFQAKFIESDYQRRAYEAALWSILAVAGLHSSGVAHAVCKIAHAAIHRDRTKEE